MKRKLISILLALALCLPLAGSAFAEGEAETPAPGEQTETLTVEAETPAEDAEPEDVTPAEDVTPDAGEAPEEADQALGDRLARLIEEGELAVGEPYVLGVKYGHLHVDRVETIDPPDPEDIVEGEFYALGREYGHFCTEKECLEALHWNIPAEGWSETEPCPACGQDNWGEANANAEIREIGDTGLCGEFYDTKCICKTAGCRCERWVHKCRVLATAALPGDEDVPEEAVPPEDVTEPEEEAPSADKPALEEKEEAAVEEDVWIYGHFHCVEEVAEEDGTTWQMGYLCYDASCQYLHGLQAADILSRTEKGLLANCAVCGRSDWGPEVVANTLYYDTENPDTHKKQENIVRYCQTTGCSGCAARLKPKEEVAHSWTKTATENYSSNGADTHTATCTYTCVCGHTKTEPESEEHTLKNMGYSGSNYHSGRLHYVGYRHVCEKCGYTTIKYVSTSCPGNNNGVGCQFFVNGVNPPIEIQDVTEPEAEAAPEGKVPSEDVIYTWDSEFPDYSDGNFISWTWTEMETEEGVKALHLCLMPIEDPAKIDVVSTTPASEGTVCITHVGKPEVIGQEYKNKGTNHEVYDVIQVKCGACGEEIIRKKLTGEEDHFWTKGGPTGNYSSNSLTHAAEYTYTCVCGATKTEADTESEEHSLEKIGYTGNNYHRGRLHYVEYRYTDKM